MTAETQTPKIGQDLNEFGTRVYSLMVSRGIKSAGKLAEAMREAGVYSITRQAVDNYTSGRRGVPVSFVLRLCDTLDLSYEERRNLAWSYTFGQK